MRQAGTEIMLKQISILIIFVFSQFSCSGNKETASESSQYTLIRDNLYFDNSGNLYLKTVDRSLAEGGTAAENEKQVKDRWLNIAYCETCKLLFTGESKKQIDNKPPDGMTELRSVIDTATFRLAESNSTENLTIYEDENYWYYHHIMADGGTITLALKPISSGGKPISTQTSNRNNNTNDTSILTPANFNKLQKYILENGKIEKVNASGRSDKPIYITYHVLEVNGIKLIVDKSNRIYFNDKNGKHLGNILLSEDGLSVSIEADDANNKTLIGSTYEEALKMIR